MTPDRVTDGAGRWLATEATLCLFIARYGLRLLGFRRLVHTLGAGSASPADPRMLKRLAAAVNGAADGRGHTCLPRAFAAAWMLRRRGLAPILHYGVRRKNGEMEAHVWLEVDGSPVIGQEQALDFALLASFPTRSTASGAP